MSNNPPNNKSNVSPEMAFEMQWENIFNELAYKVFYCTEDGKKLLNHLELKYFRSPVAYPNQEPSWAFFNEGHCELIRKFTKGMQIYMNQPEKTADTKNIKRNNA